MWPKNKFLPYLLVALVALFAGWQLGHRDLEFKKHNFVPQISLVNREPLKDVTVDMSLFWKVWEVLPQQYIDKSKIDPNKMLYGAISGMVASLGDPYTTFLDPSQNEAVSSELAGSFDGVGIQLGYNKDKQLVVIAPLDGTPAQKAGVLPKDAIVKIDGKDTFDMTLPQAVSMIRGASGTTVKITILRPGEDKTRDITLTRSKINVKSVELVWRDNIAVIKVLRFGEQTNAEWDRAIDEAVSKQAKAIVVDVRNNPGGFLNSAVYLGSEFLKGTVVVQEDASGNRKNFEVTRTGRWLDKPVVSIINGGSASASEILTGALQDRGRGKLVGEQSFGKGTVQEVINLDGGAGLHVTVLKWLVPSGKWINEVGLTPNVKVEMTKEDRDAGRDPQLDKALELVK